VFFCLKFLKLPPYILANSKMLPSQTEIRKKERKKKRLDISVSFWWRTDSYIHCLLLASPITHKFCVYFDWIYVCLIEVFRSNLNSITYPHFAKVFYVLGLTYYERVLAG
jgi:hypothetical protein